MIPSLFLAAGPLGLSFYWHLPLLIAVISLVYSATRFEHWEHILYEAFRWGIRMAGFLLVVGLVLYIVARWI